MTADQQLKNGERITKGGYSLVWDFDLEQFGIIKKGAKYPKVYFSTFERGLEVLEQKAAEVEGDNV